MSLSRVRMGQPIPRSQSRENTIIDAVNRLNAAPLNPGSFPGLNSAATGVVWVKNQCGKDLKPGAAVFLENMLTTDADAVATGKAVYKASFAKSDLSVPAVLLWPVKKDETAPAAVSGLVFLSGLPDDYDGTQPFVEIQQDGALKTGESGDIRLTGGIAAGSDHSASAVALLGASAPAAAAEAYTGYFAVIPAEDAADGTKQIKVLDNANPTSGIAGYTDLSDDPVPATVLPLQAGHLYLKAAYSETDGFSVGFGIAATLPKVSYELATILTDGTIIQRWCRNEPIYFGERFFV